MSKSHSHFFFYEFLFEPLAHFSVELLAFFFSSFWLCDIRESNCRTEVAIPFTSSPWLCPLLIVSLSRKSFPYFFLFMESNLLVFPFAVFAC